MLTKNFDQIKALAARKKVKLADVATAAGITYQQLNRIMRTQSTSLETLNRIAAALDVEPSFFLEKETNDISIGSDSPGAGAGNVVNSNSSDVLTRAFDEIAAQRRLTEDALARLSKSQEQIGELLSILKNR